MNQKISGVHKKIIPEHTIRNLVDNTRYQHRIFNWNIDFQINEHLHSSRQASVKSQYQGLIAHPILFEKHLTQPVCYSKRWNTQALIPRFSFLPLLSPGF